MRERVDVAKGQHRLELDGGRLVVVQNGVFYDQTVAVVQEQNLFGEVELAHAVVAGGHVVGREALQVFVPLGLDGTTLVLMDAQVEVHVVDDDGLVQVGDQDVPFVADFVLRHDEQPVVFAGVQPRQRGGGEGTRTAASQDLASLGIVEIYEV